MEKQAEEKGMKLGIHFALQKKNWIAMVAYLLPSTLLFVFFPYLITRAHVYQKGTVDVLKVGMFIILGLVAGFFQLLQIDVGNKIRRRISRIMLFILPALSMIMVEYINHTSALSFEEPGKILANYICYLMLFAVIYLIFRRAVITGWLGMLISLIFGIANYYVIIFRGDPVLPWDIGSLGTAMEVADRYEFVLTDAIALFFLFSVALLSLFSKMQPEHKKESMRMKLAERGVTAVLALGLYLAVMPLNVMSYLGIVVGPYNQTMSSQNTGMLAGFLANMQFMIVEKPSNYSVETLNNIKDEIDGLEEPSFLGDPGKKPTIIAVMCESMTDVLTTNPNLELSKDNMPFIHSLQKDPNVISGTAYSSVFAGNTCDSEYEFLTGNSMAFFPIGSKPYQQYVTTPQDSLVQTLEQYGYNTLAIHPANGANWQRDRVYENFGFDQFTDYYTFKTEKVMERGYTDDASSYNEVIYEYENRDKEEPLFTFLITLANHAGFEFEDYPSTVEIMSGETDFSAANQYLTSTNSSDKAYEMLIEYFEKEKEPVVILFFGDHWPFAGTNDQMSVLLDAPTFPDLSKEEFMRRQEVPYIIWANYDLEQPETEVTSINYLSSLLMRAAGLESTPYQKYLHYFSQSLPVMTGVGAIDENENIYWPDEEKPYEDLLNEYAILQYNNVFDKENHMSELFTVTP
ncbi:LTA synthase family protein [Scatolibacter rhodanostii]|uniref:LTA synthase family protein n=1 Tax=Scatolibacter rhodanostii TaxID=2014781 RepID=UPI000C089721|nr:LTA synthase family protein [Scatolibacter rhodanostii]